MMLILMIILHQAYDRMYDKVHRFVLRPILLRAMEGIGRITVFPHCDHIISHEYRRNLCRI